MSYESQVIECCRCRSVDGPFVKQEVEQFSASGARPNLTIFTCEACVISRKKVVEGWTRVHPMGH